MVKNKVAPPFRIAEFDMMAADGISYEGDVLDMAAEAKLVTRTGAWFRYGDMQLGQGREKTKDYLKEHPELVEELREKLAATHAVASGKSVPVPPGRGRGRGRRRGSAGGMNRGNDELENDPYATRAGWQSVINRESEVSPDATLRGVYAASDGNS